MTLTYSSLLAWIWRVQRGVGFWQPSHAAVPYLFWQEEHAKIIACTKITRSSTGMARFQCLCAGAEGANRGAWVPQHALGGHYGAVVDMGWGVDGACLQTVSEDQTSRIFTTCGDHWCEVARPQVFLTPFPPLLCVQVRLSTYLLAFSRSVQFLHLGGDSPVFLRT
jgi:hypothetical protein